KFHDAYAIGNQLLTTGIANKRTYVAGAGMVVRKELFRLLNDLHFKSLLTGRNEKKLSSGEDCELCLAAMLLGYDLYYDERLTFIHFMPANRLKWEYCVNMISKGQAIPQVYF